MSISIIFFGCRDVDIHKSSSTSDKIVLTSEETVTYPLHFISYDDAGAIIQDINLTIIDSNGKIVGTTKTGKDGVADISATVPIDQRYNSKIGTVTVIGYNNDKYRRTVMYEVTVAGGGQVNQNITMIPKTGERDDEVNIQYGNMYHLFPKSLADKYIPWNGK